MAIHLLRPDLKPVGCGVHERGLYCDFKPTKGEWLSMDEARKAINLALELKLASEEIKLCKSGEIDELASILGRTKKYLIKDVEVYLEPELEPEGNVEAIAVISVAAHNPLPNVSLVRVNAIAFPTKEKMEEYLKWLKEAEKRDHRVLGRKLGLFTFHEEVGPGLAIFHPKGFIVREELIKLMREINKKLGYEEVFTPHLYRAIIWKRSGHYELYRDKMVLADVEGEEYGVKPMNCPGHILIYKSEPRSYKDLPIKLSEFGTVYRWEKRGELYGLLRVRGFTQDDGHAFLREDQVKDEVKNILKAVIELLSIFGFKEEDIRFNLSTKPDQYIGTDEMWDKATDALREALEELKLRYNIKEKEGAFYGPKIDVEFRDSLGRWWQCSTIQVDFALPERFNLEYTLPDGSKARPVMVHRAILGSIERFMAIILEHFAGRLPTWLSPIQVVILPLTQKQFRYANEVASMMKDKGIRVEVWEATETLSKRIKKAYDQAIPYIIIIGENEEKNKTITIRGRRNLQARNVDPKEFIKLLEMEIKNRDLQQTAIMKILGKS